MKYLLTIEVEGKFETKRKKTKERLKEREDAIFKSLKEIVRSKMRRMGAGGTVEQSVTIEPME